MGLTYGMQSLSRLIKVLHPTRHKIGHFEDVLPSQSLGIARKKLNLTQKSVPHNIAAEMLNLTNNC